MEEKPTGVYIEKPLVISLDFVAEPKPLVTMPAFGGRGPDSRLTKETSVPATPDGTREANAVSAETNRVQEILIDKVSKPEATISNAVDKVTEAKVTASDQATQASIDIGSEVSESVSNELTDAEKAVSKEANEIEVTVSKKPTEADVLATESATKDPKTSRGVTKDSSITPTTQVSIYTLI